MIVAISVTGSIIAILSSICAIVVFLRNTKRDIRNDGKKQATQEYDIQYVGRRVDDILLEQKDTNRRLDSMAERITRVEELTKHAHKRIDELSERNK